MGLQQQASLHLIPVYALCKIIHDLAFWNTTHFWTCTYTQFDVIQIVKSKRISRTKWVYIIKFLKKYMFFSLFYPKKTQLLWY